MFRNLFLVLLISILCSCGGSGGSSGRASYSPQDNSSYKITCDEDYVYEIPENTGDGLATGDLSTKEIDVDRILEMASLMHCGERDHQLHSILISIDGELVLEKYFPGFISSGNRTVVNYGRDSLHVLASVQKSVVSALMGIAIDQGFLALEDTRLYDLFPEYTNVDWFETYEFDGEEVTKADITLRDLMTMSAGFEWDELSTHYGHAENSLTHFNDAGGDFEYLFQLPLVSPPGRDFVYSTAIANAIKEIVQRSTEQDIEDFAVAELFGPLGIDNFYWELGLSMRPRDLLKFGQLYLNEGSWGGSQIVPSEWVAQTLEKAFDLGSGKRITGYGFQWWHNGFTVDGVEYEASAALGYGGQQIMVFEAFDMVVVFTAAEYPGVHGNTRTPYMWASEYIVPAIVAPLLGGQ